MSDEATYNAEWDGLCVRCGGEIDTLDMWEAACSRCIELAAIEREIGRAVVGQAILDDGIDKLIADSAEEYEHLSELWELATSIDQRGKRGAKELIARWRRLHAEGAE